MKILDQNGTEKEAKSLILIKHTMQSAGKDNEDEYFQVKEERDFVEAEVVGKSGKEWTEWYPLDEFEELNPDIQIS